MISIRKRKRQVARLAKGPAHDWTLVWLTRYGGPKAFMLYMEPDPEVERQEFIRALTERRPLQPGEKPPMPGEVGVFEGIRIITKEPT